MPEYCTCGAQLPPDAVFCHKCGKPQREIAAVAPEPVPAPPPLVEPPPPTAAPAKVTNGAAIRTALPVAIGATCLFFLPYLNWIGAGFLTVFLYRRRTGQYLNMESGVRLGWITGLLMFAMLAVLLGGTLLMFEAVGGIPGIQAQLKNTIDPNTLKSLAILQNGHEVLKLYLELFVFVNLLSMAGGALAAKLVGHD
jgi:hypothetical protein